MRTRCLFLVLYVCLIFVSITPDVRADSWSFATIPASGDIAGPPGSTVGWGYTISNMSTSDWLSITVLNADVFQNGTPDASIFDFPTIAPNTSLLVPYDGVNGLYTFTWDATAPPGFVNSGNFVLSAELYSGDPSNGGVDLGSALDQSAAYSVTAAGAAPVPEPSTVLLLSIGIAGSVLLLRKRIMN